jgi:hypothetical protein
MVTKLSPIVTASRFRSKLRVTIRSPSKCLGPPRVGRPARIDHCRYSIMRIPVMVTGARDAGADRSPVGRGGAVVCKGHARSGMTTKRICESDGSRLGFRMPGGIGWIGFGCDGDRDKDGLVWFAASGVFAWQVRKYAARLSGRNPDVGVRKRRRLLYNRRQYFRIALLHVGYRCAGGKVVFPGTTLRITPRGVPGAARRNRLARAGQRRASAIRGI